MARQPNYQSSALRNAYGADSGITPSPVGMGHLTNLLREKPHTVR